MEAEKNHPELCNSDTERQTWYIFTCKWILDVK